MAKLSKNLQLSNITLYTAVSYLDRTCKEKLYAERALAALAIACLLIASKVEEDVCNMLTIPEILAVAQVPIGRHQILHCELYILDHLGWNLRVSTLLHFANDYHNMGMFFDGDAVDGVPLASNPESVQRATDFVRYFCDLLLMDNIEVSPDSMCTMKCVSHLNAGPCSTRLLLAPPPHGLQHATPTVFGRCGPRSWCAARGTPCPNFFPACFVS